MARHYLTTPVRITGMVVAIAMLLIVSLPADAGADGENYSAWRSGSASGSLAARGPVPGSVSELDREGEMHLRLLRSEPAADSTVRVAPTELRLWFTQRPELSLTSARISMGNHTVATGRASLGSSEGEGVLVVLPISGRLEAGLHRVAWRTMAPDGHVVNGEFSFTLAASRPSSGN